MQHKVKVTVIDKKLYPELQTRYCNDPNSGACPCYNVGDEFIFERYNSADDFWHMGLNTLKQSVLTADNTDTADNIRQNTAGGTDFPHCSEAWDAVSRYIYTGLQGGSIMRGWMNNERVMIACCSDGTRPVIFKIERLDYKAVYIDGIVCDACRTRIKEAVMQINGVTDAVFRKNEDGTEYIEIFLDKDIEDKMIADTINCLNKYHVLKID